MRLTHAFVIRKKMRPDALLYLAKNGRGITCVPDFAMKIALAQGSLEPVLVDYMKRSSTFHVLWPSSKQISPKVRVFVDDVASSFAAGFASKNDAERKIESD